MRVLTLSSVYPSATMPTRGLFVHERTRHIARLADVEVVAPVSWFPLNRRFRGVDRTSVASEETRDGLTVHHPRFFSVPGLFKSLDAAFYFVSLLPALRRLGRRFRFELVDAHFGYPDGVGGLLLAMALRLPLTVTLRGSESRLAGSRLHRAQLRWLLRRADRTIAVSRSLGDLALSLGAPASRIRVIPNGIDGSRFRRGSRAEARRQLGLPGDRPIVISVGGLTKRKGHHRILEVLPGLLVDHPDLLVVVVGGATVEGDIGPKLHRLRSELGLDRHVLLPGNCPHEQVPTWLQAADLFCLATENEGRPNAVLEAMACGLPVVTTDVGGNAEIVEPGRNGLLVPFGDAGALSGALARALAVPWNRGAISDQARLRTWEETARQVSAEFHEVLRERSRPTAAPVADSPEGAR
jgi:teichuronic acid biosynthesis glycosyltransferase TuaC